MTNPGAASDSISATGSGTGGRIRRARRLTNLLRKFLPRVVLLGVLAVAVLLVVRNGPSLREAISQLGIGALVTSLLLGSLGTWAIGQVWLHLLRGLGAEVRTTAATEVFFVSQLGKYLPGSVWPVLAQMEFGRRSGTSPRVMLAANIMMIAVVVSTGLIVAGGILPWTDASGIGGYWPVFLALIPLLACLYPNFLPMVMDKVFELFKREPLHIRVNARSMVTACSWGLLVWLILGSHIVVMTAQFTELTPRSVLISVGALSLAFAAGIIFIPAPAGAGVRDAVLITFLAPQIGAANALAVALASRVVLIIADVIMAGVGLLVGRRNALNRPMR